MARRRRRSVLPGVTTSALATLLALAAACGADGPEVNPIVPVGAGGKAGAGGASSGGAGGESGSDCFTNPKTHHEIINACTSVVRVKKSPALKGLNADGSLPPPP